MEMATVGSGGIGTPRTTTKTRSKPSSGGTSGGRSGGSESGGSDDEKSKKETTTKKRERRPLGVVQASEIEARPKRSAKAARTTDSNITSERPATRYSLRSRSTAAMV